MKNYKTFYENTILENIDFEGFDVIQPKNDFEKIQLVYTTFQSEYLHQNNKHLNETFLFSEWLRGLPSCLTVPFYNYDILQNAQKANLLKLNNTKSVVLKEDQFLQNYWQKLAIAFFTLKNNL